MATVPQATVAQATENQEDVCLPALIAACELFCNKIQEVWSRSRLRGEDFTNGFMNHQAITLCLRAEILLAELRALLLSLDHIFPPDLAVDRDTFVDLLGSLDHMREVGRMPTVWEQLDKLDDMGYLFEAIQYLLRRALDHRAEQSTKTATVEQPGR